jgi:hypothetical protein
MKSNLEIDRCDLMDLCVCACRYALGRRTYITSVIADIIDKYAESIDTMSLNLMNEEIQHAIIHEQAGDQCDIDNWTDLSHRIISVLIQRGLDADQEE